MSSSSPNRSSQCTVALFPYVLRGAGGSCESLGLWMKSWED